MTRLRGVLAVTVACAAVAVVAFSAVELSRFQNADARRSAFVRFPQRNPTWLISLASVFGAYFFTASLISAALPMSTKARCSCG